MIMNIEECVKKSVNEIFKELELKVNEIKNNLSELSERVNNIEKSIPNIKSIHQELNYLKSKIEHQENLNVSYNLRICGVPYTEIV